MSLEVSPLSRFHIQPHCVLQREGCSVHGFGMLVFGIHGKVHKLDEVALVHEFGFARVPCPLVVDAVKVVVGAMVVRVPIRQPALEHRQWDEAFTKVEILFVLKIPEAYEQFVSTPFNCRQRVDRWRIAGLRGWGWPLEPEILAKLKEFAKNVTISLVAARHEI